MNNTELPGRNSRMVKVADIPIGGNSPVIIQSMLSVPLTDRDAAALQALSLEAAGCRILRAAVPDEESAIALRDLAARTSMPLVADIHFDYRLALLAAENGASKIRINPGNIGSRNRVAAVVSSLKEKNIPVRIGVNSGSLEKELLERFGGATPEAMVESAAKHIAILESLNFDNFIVSLKASDVMRTVQANRLFSEKFDCPVHLGITEAGSGYQAIVTSAVGIGTLLMEGIGDTVRVSVTGEPVQEITAAKEILKAAGLYSEGVRVVSCPTCGRTKVNLAAIAEDVREALASIKQPLTVAVMGCAVNGPGEAKDADAGVACGSGTGLLFRRGEKLRSVPEKDIARELLAEVNRLIEEEQGSSIASYQ